MLHVETFGGFMKIRIAILSAFLFLVVLSALAAVMQMDGNFVSAHKTYVVGYEDEAACAADQGSWDGEACYFDVEDSVAVTKTNNGYSLSVETIGSNAHVCNFEGEAQIASAKELVSSVKTEEEREDDNGNWSSVPVTCSVSVTYKDSNTISVTNNGNCGSFCGARAWLHIDEAKRK
jgi:hypothetical protein